MSWPSCKRCKRPIEFNDSVGYSRDFCGPLCDGSDSGRRCVIRAMMELAVQLRAKGLESEGSDADLAFEAGASSIERVCREVMS
jgi:hypothetical protein